MLTDYLNGEWYQHEPYGLPQSFIVNDVVFVRDEFSHDSQYVYSYYYTRAADPCGCNYWQQISLSNELRYNPAYVTARFENAMMAASNKVLQHRQSGHSETPVPQPLFGYEVIDTAFPDPVITINAVQETQVWQANS